MTKRIVEYPVPLMLKQILKDKNSGELIIKTGNFSKSLFFLSGDLIFAKTSVIQERLGEILFKIGKISQAQFWSIKQLLVGKTEKVGKILVQSNILTQRDLFLALIYQFRIIAISTFSLNSGEWEFIPRTPKIGADSNFKIDLAGIIIEGVKKMRSTAFSYYRNRFYYSSAAINSIPKAISESLPVETNQFYRQLTNYNDTSNQQIMAALKIPEDVYWQNIAALFLLNIIDFTEIKIDEDISKNIDDIIALYDKISSHKIDYYDLFGLKSNAAVDEIKNVYFRFAKKYHPDRVSQAPDPDIKEKSNFVFSEINKAYETLSDENKRKEYDTKGYRESIADKGSREKMIEKARILLRKAKTLYDQKKFWEAVALLDEAIRITDDRASYYLLLGICQTELPDMVRMAAANIQKAIELEPLNVEAYAAMGLLFASEKQFKRAEGFFRKALSINPDHSLSKKKLKEILGADEKKRKFPLVGKPGK